MSATQDGLRPIELSKKKKQVGISRSEKSEMSQPPGESIHLPWCNCKQPVENLFIMNIMIYVNYASAAASLEIVGRSALKTGLYTQWLRVVQ